MKAFLYAVTLTCLCSEIGAILAPPNPILFYVPQQTLSIDFTTNDTLRGYVEVNSDFGGDKWNMMLDAEQSGIVPGPLIGSQALHIHQGYNLRNKQAVKISNTPNVCLQKPMECDGITISFWLNVQKMRETHSQFQTICRTANTGKTIGGILVTIDESNHNLEFYVINPSGKAGFKNFNSAKIHIGSVYRKWSWVTLTWEAGKTVKIYLNGVEASNNEYSQEPLTEERAGIYGIYVYSTTLNFGADLGPEFYIDEFKYWPYVLTNKAIINMFDKIADGIIHSVKTTTAVPTTVITKPRAPSLQYHFTADDIARGTCKATAENGDENWYMEIDSNYIELATGAFYQYNGFHIQLNHQLYNKVPASLANTNMLCLQHPAACDGISVTLWLNVQTWMDIHIPETQVIFRTASSDKMRSGVMAVADKDISQLEFYVVNPSEVGVKNVHVAKVLTKYFTGEWVWIAFTWSANGGIQIYLNGHQIEYSEEPTSVENAGVTGETSSHSTLYFGGRLGPEFYIDEFNFWPITLRKEEVYNMYSDMEISSVSGNAPVVSPPSLLFGFTPTDIRRGTCYASGNAASYGWMMNIDGRYCRSAPGAYYRSSCFHMSSGYEMYNRQPAMIKNSENACLQRPMDCYGISVSFWLNVRSWQPSGGQRICGTSTYQRNHCGFSVVTDNDPSILGFYVINPSFKSGYKNFCSAKIYSSVVTKQWSWLSMTWEADGTMKIYVNGTELNEDEYAQPPQAIAVSNITGQFATESTLHIGGESSPEFLIDDFRYWPEPLLSRDIRSLKDSMPAEMMIETTTNRATTKPLTDAQTTARIDTTTTSSVSEVVTKSSTTVATTFSSLTNKPTTTTTPPPPPPPPTTTTTTSTFASPTKPNTFVSTEDNMVLIVSTETSDWVGTNVGLLVIFGLIIVSCVFISVWYVLRAVKKKPKPSTSCVEEFEPQSEQLM